MNINGIEFEFDSTDYLHMEKFEQAIDKMGETEKGLSELKGSAFIKGSVKMLADFFEDATGVKVLDGVTSYTKAQDCYYQLLDEVKRQKDTISAKYNPKRLR
ncbi:DUF6673 family protein [Parasporobacterium paucivorans]|uniref:DUF6673 domain-containing protein n=1 Tax=Parasporobacterium paucivorans DSM 15970 TaxID=1122934 RepID=A0A1M6B1M0_9FIRM|nr:DUF6673 family protein [Parasporobacterium paucivorans]SHI42632.1 hypothetical protein SAMN02745691_00236 [Parasporobacterium paucivorans DSM 15970]